MQFNPLKGKKFQYIPEKQSITAKCCHCGDKSFPVEVEGKIGIGSTEYTLAIPRPDETPIDETHVSFDVTRVIINTEVLKVWN
jgi:hypothetical protein